MKFIAILALLFLNSATPIYAQTTKTWSSQAGGRCVKTVTSNGNGLGDVTYNDIASIQGLECLFYNVLQVVVIIAGLAFLFMFISGGFKYLFSSNEQKAVAAASSTLTMAIIGLIGIIASWLILSFIQKFTGINITQFVIPG
ncbi:MAG TPA: hypothetical protein VN174_02795 [Candidatus Methanoperedens sp.]|nr:hypothetical protein [Candidatus Methanoperedens sp.]